MPTTTDTPYVPDESEIRASYAAAGSVLIGTAFYRIALNNAEPWHRRYSEATGTLYRYSTGARADAECIALYSPDWRDWHDAVYLIDNGHSVRPFYVAAYREEGIYSYPFPTLHASHLILHPMPTNYHADGSPVLRANDQRPVDYSTWALGPRRAYHVKVSER